MDPTVGAPDRTFNHEKIERACHALSLDDERTTFHPVLWNEKDVPKEKLSQVWFSGVHSNVGGGYSFGEKLIQSSERKRETSWVMDLGHRLATAQFRSQV